MTPRSHSRASRSRDRDAEIVVLIPVFNDWDAVALLLPRLDAALHAAARRARVLLVDDGSVLRPTGSIVDAPLEAIQRVDVLHLRRNLGHQRAIAIGLTYVEQRIPCGRVVVMDGDGEDLPGDVPRLLQESESASGDDVVFAARRKRSEGVVFRVGYGAYRVFHRALTGIPVNVGNFSVVPRGALRRLVVVSELWNHFAASVFRARLPYRLVPTARGSRLAGRPTMNFVSLVVHGVSALLVHGEVLGVRVLIATVALFAIMSGALGAVLTIRFVSDLAIPGWATSTGGIILVLMSQSVLLGFFVTFQTIGSRAQASFLPLRDFTYFVDGFETLYELPRFDVGVVAISRPADVVNDAGRAARQRAAVSPAATSLPPNPPLASP